MSHAVNCISFSCTLSLDRMRSRITQTNRKLLKQSIQARHPKSINKIKQNIFTHSRLLALLTQIVKDPRTTRPYLFSDGQNMYNRVVLVCTVNVYISASLCR